MSSSVSVREQLDQKAGNIAGMSGGFEKLALFNSIVEQAQIALPELAFRIYHKDPTVWFCLSAVDEIARHLHDPIDRSNASGVFDETRQKTLNWLATNGYWDFTET